MPTYLLSFHGGKMPETPEEGASVLADPTEGRERTLEREQFQLEIGRAIAPGRHRNDERRLGALFQCLGWF